MTRDSVTGKVSLKVNVNKVNVNKVNVQVNVDKVNVQVNVNKVNVKVDVNKVNDKVVQLPVQLPVPLQDLFNDGGGSRCNMPTTGP